MENKQTAVDFFMNSLAATSYSNDFWKAYKEAKAMEKEQIIDAYSNGLSDEGIKSIHTKANAEEYYNETYGE